MTTLEEHPRGRLVTSKGPVVRGLIIGYFILALGLLGAIAREEHLSRKAEADIVATQVSNDARIARQGVRLCKDIERLKFRVRFVAMRSYRQLQANARLLGIPLTRELRERAQSDRDATLRRYRSERCPRPLIRAP
jgi:hypothetical protein